VLEGKILGLYVTMGEYDIVAVTEGPSDEVAAAVALSIASKGNAKTTTMRAFTELEASFDRGRLYCLRREDLRTGHGALVFESSVAWHPFLLRRRKASEVLLIFA
jgi:hypothetical protein